MTSSRIVRSTKGRIFLYACAALLLTGLIACYSNVRSQLEDVQTSYSICLRDHSDFTKKISDLTYKNQHLEKILEVQKNEHNRLKTDVESERKEEKLKNDKTLNEAKLRFNTLQQHYNLLQTQHDDFKDECSKIQREQLDNINQLQAKLQEVQAQMKIMENERDDNDQHLKVKNEGLQNEIKQLKEQLTVQKNKMEVSSTEVNNKVIPPSVVTSEANKAADSFNGNVNDNVLPMPKQEPERVSSSKSTAKSISSPNLQGAQPLISPSSTPETKKSSVKAPNVILPLPYQQVPQGVVPVNKNLFDETKQNKAENNASNQVDNLLNAKSADNEIANDGQEMLDLPNNQAMHKEENLLQKSQDDPFNQVDYDQHEAFDDGDPDDAADGALGGGAAPEEAIRN